MLGVKKNVNPNEVLYFATQKENYVITMKYQLFEWKGNWARIRHKDIMV